MRDDAEHFARFFVDDWNRDKVVLFNLLNRLFAVFSCVDRNEDARLLHEFRDRRVLLIDTSKEFARRNDARKFSVGVEHIEIIDGLHQVSLNADFRNRLGDGHIFAKPHEVGRHFRAACVVRVAAQKRDVFLVFF